MSQHDHSVTKPDLTVAMRHCATDAIRLAESQFQIPLDGSYESIRDLDRILEIQHRAIPRGILKLFRKGPDENAIARFAYLWGGYLGETLRARWGGDWEMPEDGVMAGLACLHIAGLTLTPISRVGKRITYGQAEDVWAYALALQAHIESLEPPTGGGLESGS